MILESETICFGFRFQNDRKLEWTDTVVTWQPNDTDVTDVILQVLQRNSSILSEYVPLAALPSRLF